MVVFCTTFVRSAVALGLHWGPQTEPHGISSTTMKQMFFFALQRKEAWIKVFKCVSNASIMRAKQFLFSSFGIIFKR